MSNVLKPDICVIGGGSGGLSVAAAAASFGVPVPPGQVAETVDEAVREYAREENDDIVFARFFPLLETIFSDAAVDGPLARDRTNFTDPRHVTPEVAQRITAEIVLRLASDVANPAVPAPAAAPENVRPTR